MPIRPENRDRYPKDWPIRSRLVRFVRAKGRCECAGECGRGTHDGRCPNRHGEPAYARVDLRANRTFNWSRSRLTLFGEVINVLNRDNVRFVPPSINVTARRVSDIFERMLPILPSLGALIEW